MSSFKRVFWSSVGKKFITGVTGIALILFLVVHLLGNLTIYMGGNALNHYAHFLESLVHGLFVYVFEAGLIILLLFHLVSAVSVALLDKEKARPVKYKKQKHAGESRKTLSSRSMIISGLVILVFMILHVKMFKFTPVPMIDLGDGHKMKNLTFAVVEAFKTPWIVIGYTAVMVLLGFHLRHGFWSAFQSLGWTNGRTLNCLYGLGLVVGLLMSIGFLILPLFVYFFVDPATATNLGGH